MSGGHDHHHHHHHAPAQGVTNTRAFALAVTLNLGFTLIEATLGFLSGSMALVADAGHNLSDVLALLLAWGASVLSNRPPSERYTYGLKSSSILAAIGNAALLWIALGAILVETVRRFFDPSPVEGMTMMAVAGIGILINGFSAVLFARGSKSDLNLRAAFLHLMADAAVSAGVVIAGLLILWTGFMLIDPITSLVITGVIGWSSWGLLKDSLRMGMLAAPDAIDVAEVRSFLASRPDVAAVHDLHVWPISTTETALTAHLVMPHRPPNDHFLHALSQDLHEQFGIGHPTIQIEIAGGPECALEAEGVI
jgi:cobalt-zinc-cadmium efflux system protein